MRVRAGGAGTSTHRCPRGGAAAGGARGRHGEAAAGGAMGQRGEDADCAGRLSELPMGREGPASAFEMHRGEAATAARLQIRSCPRSPPWTAPRRCGGQAHTPDPPRRRSGCRSSTLRRIRSESVRGEERTERERRVSELGFRARSRMGFFVGQPWDWWAGTISFDMADAPYLLHIWAGYEGCRSARAFEARLRGPIGSDFCDRSVTGRPSQVFETDLGHPAVDALRSCDSR